MSTPVTLIINAYNSEKYLEIALQSVFAQSFKDIEVICVDDGSQDRTPTILANYQKQHPNFHVITNSSNLGLGRSRQIGLSHATGDYIQFLDADDWLEPNCIETLYNAAIQENVDIVVCRHNIVDNDGKFLFPSELKITPNPSSVVDDYDILSFPPHTWDKLVKKSLTDDISWEVWGEDIYYWWQIAVKANKIMSVDQLLYNYRVSNTSVQLKPQITISAFDTIFKTLNFLKRHGDPKVLQMFYLYIPPLVLHVLYKCKPTLLHNPTFAVAIYKRTKQLMDSREPLSSEFKDKEKLYPYADYQYCEHLYNDLSFDEWKEEIGINKFEKFKYSYKKYKILNILTFRLIKKFVMREQHYLDLIK